MANSKEIISELEVNLWNEEEERRKNDPIWQSIQKARKTANKIEWVSAHVRHDPYFQVAIKTIEEKFIEIWSKRYDECHEEDEIL